MFFTYEDRRYWIDCDADEFYESDGIVKLPDGSYLKATDRNESQVIEFRLINSRNRTHGYNADYYPYKLRVWLWENLNNTWHLFDANFVSHGDTLEECWKGVENYINKSYKVTFVDELDYGRVYQSNLYPEVKIIVRDLSKHTMLPEDFNYLY